MNPRTITLMVAISVAATGCGMSAAVLRTAPHSGAAVDTALHNRVVPPAVATRAPVAASPTAVPTPAPPPPPQLVVTAAEANISGPTFAVTLVDTTGRIVAATAVPADAQWTVGAGRGGAYWVTGGRLQRLGADGHVTTLTTVPSTESGRVVSSPDGSQWAYATTSTASSGIVTNRLYRGTGSGPAQLIAERVSDPAHPTADAPAQWQYYLLSWSRQGILIERQPTGGCGCGTPFDMQMSAASSALIDPVTGMATPLATSATCPLSGAGSDGTAACFEASPSAGGSVALDVLGHQGLLDRYTMSGANLGGDATFDGTSLAYSTVPVNAGGCGGPDWRPVTTLHVMDISTGTTRVVGPQGFQPSLWLDNGSLLGTRSVAAAAGGSTNTVVILNPITGAVTTLLHQGAMVIGLA